MILSTSFTTTTASPLAIAIGTGSPDALPIFGALLGDAVGATTVAAGAIPPVPGLILTSPPVSPDRQADALSGMPLPPVPDQSPLAPTITWRSSAAPVAVATPQAASVTSPVELPTPTKNIAKLVSPFAARRASLASTVSPIVRGDTAANSPIDSDADEALADETAEPDPDQANPFPSAVLAVVVPPTSEASPPTAVGGDTRSPTSRRAAVASSSPTDDAAPGMRSSDTATLERPLSASLTTPQIAAGGTPHPAAVVAPPPVPTGHEPVAQRVPVPAAASNTAPAIADGGQIIRQTPVNPAVRVAAIAPRAIDLPVTAPTDKAAARPAAAQPQIDPRGASAAVIDRPEQPARASITPPSITATNTPATVVAPAIRDSATAFAHAARGDGRADSVASPAGVVTAPTAGVPSLATVPITQGPAIQVFGAAIAAARRNERGTADDRTIDPASLQPVVDAAHPTVAATGGAQQAPLDLRQDRWPHAMIDRIEYLRDTAAAATASAADTRIRLIPDALGTIDVSITRDGDSVAVRFQAEHAGTRALLQDSQARLADIADARGLRLSGTSVDAGSAGTGQQQRALQQQPTLPSPPRRAPTRDSATADDADAGRVA